MSPNTILVIPWTFTKYDKHRSIHNETNPHWDRMYYHRNKRNSCLKPQCIKCVKTWCDCAVSGVYILVDFRKEQHCLHSSRWCCNLCFSCSWFGYDDNDDDDRIVVVTVVECFVIHDDDQCCCIVVFRFVIKYNDRIVVVVFNTRG